MPLPTCGTAGGGHRAAGLTGPLRQGAVARYAPPSRHARGHPHATDGGSPAPIAVPAPARVTMGERPVGDGDRASTRRERPGPRWASTYDNPLRHKARPWASHTPPRVRKGTREGSGRHRAATARPGRERPGPRWASTCANPLRHKVKPWANDASPLPAWPQERCGTGPGGQRGRECPHHVRALRPGDSWRGRPARSSARRCPQGGRSPIPEPVAQGVGSPGADRGPV